MRSRLPTLQNPTLQRMDQATAHYEAGRLPQAEKICRLILQTQPEFSPALFQLGLIAVSVGKTSQAAELMAEASRLDPSSGLYFRSLGEVYRRLGRLGEAIASARQAVRLLPGNSNAHYNLALALADSGNLAAAAEHYRTALANNPAHGLAANNLGTVLQRQGDEPGAEKAFARAVAIDPRHAEAQTNLGALFSLRGELQRARACFEAAINAAPDFVNAHYNLCTLKKYHRDDPHLTALAAVARNARTLPDEARLRFCFAYGKALEDIARYDEAFAAYAEGNRLKRATLNYDEQKTAQKIAHIIKTYDAVFAAAPLTGCTDATPVFIVGMPRSGTTLIEQILATHSRVHGAGEIHDLGQVISDLTGCPPEGQYMGWLKAADEQLLSRIGAAYVARLRVRDSRALRITDKMPGNYYYVGLIRKILPKAKIIHVVRDPMDICFSNFSRLFDRTMDFAYDLAELGRYYRNYRQLMDHWKAVLPADTVLDVRYEDLVQNQEAQSRRLLAYCGLEWEDACLAFHKNPRRVSTASTAQVREPMYQSSVARWKHFEAHLGELRAAIDGTGKPI